MKIEITRTDGTVLLYALQLLLEKQWEGGYTEIEIMKTRDIAETVFDAMIQGD